MQATKLVIFESKFSIIYAAKPKVSERFQYYIVLVYKNFILSKLLYYLEF